ncbi:MAG: hypothetical protein HN348_22800, partial [Proteobacteria bacterium]|nr:hypothetical protein [Pseudomonadota bacterium]
MKSRRDVLYGGGSLVAAAYLAIEWFAGAGVHSPTPPITRANDVPTNVPTPPITRANDV